jgi:hypothetical protein
MDTAKNSIRSNEKSFIVGSETISSSTMEFVNELKGKAKEWNIDGEKMRIGILRRK